MSLTRAELLSDQTREDLCKQGRGDALLSEQALRQSLDDTFRHWDQCSDVWLFGYGSLIWNPQITYTEKRLATLHGYHRSLCLWSQINRGTPQNPGLVLGLEAKGSCQGMVYRIPAAAVAEEMVLIWRREMLMGFYQPTWVKVETACGECLMALTFVVRIDAPGYAEDLNDAEVVRIMRSAKGRYGSCADYVCNTLTSLHENNIDDANLNRICCQYFRSE
ncbi:MAG: hypothetical protein RLZZ502_782 [Pseudomonadota bacterium]